MSVLLFFFLRTRRPHTTAAFLVKSPTQFIMCEWMECHHFIFHFFNSLLGFIRRIKKKRHSFFFCLADTRLSVDLVRWKPNSKLFYIHWSINIFFSSSHSIFASIFFVLQFAANFSAQFHMQTWLSWMAVVVLHSQCDFLRQVRRISMNGIKDCVFSLQTFSATEWRKS